MRLLGTSGVGICLLVASLIAPSCSKQESEHIEQARSSLLPKLSHPFDLEAYPTTAPSEAAITWACGTTQCLAVYSRTIGGVSYTFYTRADQSGNLTDTPPLHFPYALSDGTVAVGARNNEFLVSGWRPIPGHQAEPHGFLVNGSDGSVRDVSQAIPYGTFQIASDSGHWFMLFSSGSSYFSQILDTEFAAVGGSPTSTTTVIACPTPRCSPGSMHS
jgi:hypothetical protein